MGYIFCPPVKLAAVYFAIVKLALIRPRLRLVIVKIKLTQTKLSLKSIAVCDRLTSKRECGVPYPRLPNRSRR
jgi:hypothetical protein